MLTQGLSGKSWQEEVGSIYKVQDPYSDVLQDDLSLTHVKGESKREEDEERMSIPQWFFIYQEV